MANSEVAATRDLTADVFQFEEKLSAQGDICIGSGRLDSGPLSVSLHTSFGPPDLDKECNQDFVLGWKRHADSNTGVQLAVALADGVTSSYWSEAGAATACWAALSTLVSEHEGAGRDRTERAVAAANDAIAGIVDRIRDTSDTFRPDDEFESTWEFRLDEGLLLQTTLTLLWVEGGRLFVGMVGDGGAVYSSERNEAGSKRVMSVNGDLNESQQVNALGPHVRGAVPLDCYTELDIALIRDVAVFTDGITRGFENLECLLELITQTNAESGETSVAKRVVDGLLETRPEDFQDNLSLCWLTVRTSA